jgi:hypothetical protein
MFFQKIGARAIVVSPQRKKMNIHARNLFDLRGADANSCQIKTPHAAEIMVAPWPIE